MSSRHKPFAAVRTSSQRSKQHLEVNAALIGLHNCITFTKSILRDSSYFTKCCDHIILSKLC